MARKLTIVIAGDYKAGAAIAQAQRGTSRLGGSFDVVGQKVGGLGGKIKGLGKIAAIGLGGALVGTAALAKGFVDAATESQKVTKQTDAVIKSMGGASKVTSGHVADLSTQLSLMSGVDDELIQAGENVLLTFGKVRNETGKGNDVFDRATKSALNMSVALGTDLSAANIQIGKALNDPIKGITALSRAGVSFTEKQKETIKSLVATGDTLGAQKIILSELDKQFGGSAEAQATAGEKLKVAWGNVQEQLGGILLPILGAVASFLAKRLPGAMKTAGRIIGPIAKKISMFFKSLFSGFTEDEGTKVERIALAIRDVIMTKLVPAFKAVASFITDKVLPAIRGIFDFLMKHKEILVGIATVIGVALVSAFVAWAVAAGSAAVATIAAIAPVVAIMAAIAALVAGVIYAYKHWGWFKTAVDAVASFMVDTLWPAIKTVVTWLKDHLGPVVSAVAGFFTDTLWPALQTVASFIIDEVVPRVGDLIRKLADFGQKAIDIGIAIGEFIVDIKEKFDGVIEFFKKLPGRIVTAIGNLGSTLLQAGKDLAGGFLRGIKDAFFGQLDVDAIKAAAQAKWEAEHPGAGGPLAPQQPGGHRAMGGLVTAGRSYLVGERGPEMMVPGVSGTIIPNHALGGGGTTVVVHVHGSVLSSRDLVAEINKAIDKGIKPKGL